MRNRLASRFGAAATELANQAHKAKDQWVDRCMNKLLPADMCVHAHSKKGRHRLKVVRYLQQAKIRLAEHPDKTVLMVDSVPVAEFCAQFKEGKLTITSTLPESKKDN